MAGQDPGRARKSPLDSLLSVFTEVRAGEGLLAILMTLNVFLLLNSYSVLKPIREGLIQNATFLGIKGAELKSYLGAVMAFLLIFVVWAYGQLASRVDRLKLLNVTSALVVVCILVFYALFRFFDVGGPGIAMAYFVWLGIVGVFIVAQFWGYANDIYTEKQGKRLFAIIAVGQSTGAIFGAWMTSKFGQEYMVTLLFSAAVLIGLSQIMYNVVNRRVAKHGTSAEHQQELKQHEEPLSKEGGFELIFRKRYLLGIALMILVATLFNTNGEYLIGSKFGEERDRLYPDDMYSEAWVARVRAGKQDLPDSLSRAQASVETDEAARVNKVEADQKGFGTSFFGGFQLWVNIVGALVQLLLVSRIFKYFGVRVALFVLPVIACGGALFFGLVGSLFALRLSKTAENALDYSLQNTVKAALFLPTSREEKYKAKAATDTFFFRVGDASSAAMVALATHVLFTSVQQFALINVALGVIWVLLCVMIAREHRKMVPDDAIATAK